MVRTPEFKHNWGERAADTTQLLDQQRKSAKVIIPFGAVIFAIAVVYTAVTFESMDPVHLCIGPVFIVVSLILMATGAIMLLMRTNRVSRGHRISKAQVAQLLESDYLRRTIAKVLADNAMEPLSSTGDSYRFTFNMLSGLKVYVDYDYDRTSGEDWLYIGIKGITRYNYDMAGKLQRLLDGIEITSGGWHERPDSGRMRPGR